MYFRINELFCNSVIMLLCTVIEVQLKQTIVNYKYAQKYLLDCLSITLSYLNSLKKNLTLLG